MFHWSLGLRSGGRKGLGMDFTMARSTRSVQRRGRQTGHLALPGSFLNHSVLPAMLPSRSAKGLKKSWVCWLSSKLLILFVIFLDWPPPLLPFPLMPGEGWDSECALLPSFDKYILDHLCRLHVQQKRGTLWGVLVPSLYKAFQACLFIRLHSCILITISITWDFFFWSLKIYNLHWEHNWESCFKMQS